MPGEPISDEKKQMIMAELIAGAKPIDLKNKYNVSLPTITRIKQSIAPNVREKMDLSRQETLADLVLTHLEESLKGAINVTRMTENQEWMRVQNAADLNKLYGTMTDKSIRMAETIEMTSAAVRAEEEDNEVLNQQHIEQ